MKKILTQLKDRIVIFFTLPFKRACRKFWAEIDERVNYYVQSEFENNNPFTNLESAVDSLESQAIRLDDLNGCLWDDYDFCSLDEKITTLENQVDELNDESIQDMIDKRLEELINKKFTIEITLKPKE
jgi:ribosome-associated translation inhibitor RaiA|tara:strand:- start:376 stop:759 length:384 start_codon:yes stop_codon:yes gene_type:complete